MAGRQRVPRTPDGFLSPAEFARQVGVGYSTVLRFIREGRVAALREGTRMVLIHESEIQRLRQQQATPQLKRRRGMLVGRRDGRLDVVVVDQPRADRGPVPIALVPAPPADRSLPTEERLSRLAESFPALRGAPGVRPWDPVALDAWAAGPVPSSGALCAAQLVLTAFNWTATWQCGPFCLGRAIATWDAQQRAAFAAYARDPWLA